VLDDVLWENDELGNNQSSQDDELNINGRVAPPASTGMMRDTAATTSDVHEIPRRRADDQPSSSGVSASYFNFH